MSNKTIKMNLSYDSIQNAIKQLRTYQSGLKGKNELFVKRLAEIGIPVIDQNIASVQGDSDKSHNIYIKTNSFGNYAQAILVCEGTDLLFIEFGAGVHYNTPAGTSPHPKGQELGYTIGSYGQGKGKNDSWVYYSETGEWIRSCGTEATMPVYKASVEIMQSIRKIAKEVFLS
jgi:hypothetical protein